MNCSIHTLNDSYKEILKLSEMLTNKGISCELHRLYDGWILFYPSKENCVADAIQHNGSYGHSQDKLEIMGEKILGHDDVEGYLTAKEVCRKFENHWRKANRKPLLVNVRHISKGKE